MSTLRIGTVEGLIEPPGGVTVTGPTRVFGDAALCADGRVLWYSSGGWTELASAPDLLCAVDAPGGLLIGTEGAHLHAASARPGSPGSRASRPPRAGTTGTRRGAVHPRRGRSRARTTTSCSRASTSVGSPARTTVAAAGTRRSTSRPTSIRSAPCRGAAELVIAAAAVGFCRSDDSGVTWRVMAEGLHATYCRAVGDRRRRGHRQRVRRSPGPAERAVPPGPGVHRAVRAGHGLDRGQRRHPCARRDRRPGRLRDARRGRLALRRRRDHVGPSCATTSPRSRPSASSPDPPTRFGAFQGRRGDAQAPRNVLSRWGWT